MNKWVKNIILAGVLSSVAMISLVGCSSKKNDEDYKIKLGYYNCDHMTPGPIADAAGIYKNMGLNVEITGGGKIPEAMTAGHMDAGYIGIENAYRAVKNNVPLMVGAQNHIGGSYYIVASNDVKDAKDLLGQKMGIGQKPEESIAWCEMTKELGIPKEGTSYQGLNFDGDSAKYLALKTGEIKGYTCCDPWGSMAEYEKTGKILKMYKGPGGKEAVCCTFTLNKNFVDSHPELAKKLVQAHVEAIKYMYENPTKSAKIFAETYKVPEEVALMTIYKKTVGEGRTITWEVVKEDFDRHINAVIEVDPELSGSKSEDVLDMNYIKSLNLPNFDSYIKEKVDKNFPVGMSYEQWKAKIKELGV